MPRHHYFQTIWICTDFGPLVQEVPRFDLHGDLVEFSLILLLLVVHPAGITLLDLIRYSRRYQVFDFPVKNSNSFFCNSTQAFNHVRLTEHCNVFALFKFFSQ